MGKKRLLIVRRNIPEAVSTRKHTGRLGESVSMLVQTLSTVAVFTWRHAHAGKQEMFCSRCLPSAGNTREGELVN